MGSMAAAISPALVGFVKTQTGSIYLAFGVIGALLIVGAILLLVVIPARLLKEQKNVQDQYAGQTENIATSEMHSK